MDSHTMKIINMPYWHRIYGFNIINALESWSILKPKMRGVTGYEPT